MKRGLKQHAGNRAVELASEQSGARVRSRSECAMGRHAMGAEGLREQQPFLRHLAAAQVATLVDGSTDMLLDRVARGLRKASAPGASNQRRSHTRQT